MVVAGLKAEGVLMPTDGTGLYWSCASLLQSAPHALVWDTCGFEPWPEQSRVLRSWAQWLLLLRDAASPCAWGWSSVSAWSCGLQETCWHRSGCWQRAGHCLRELLAGLGECLGFKRSETRNQN